MLIVFTDLDGTLLDHHDYGFEPALPALEALRRRQVPLVLTTSKTLAEVRLINAALDNTQAVIVENGGAIALPATLAGQLAGGQPDTLAGFEAVDDHRVLRNSPAYAAIRAFIAQQRTTHGYRLTGFGDMTAADIAHHTGLSTDQAVLAAQRLCSEPFLWHDSEARLQRFREAAADAGLGMTRGGRFWHLMGDTSKARAMHQLREWIDHGRGRSVTVALGDSDNDREMLEQADIAVCVRRHDGTMLDCEGQQRTLRTGQPGPTGWNSAVLEILRDFRPPDR
ncbi:MAG: HAD-IIB family hydrolase [Gammaproteobacteria bacterium]|nr:HAD-IIB family hydrolase [Gammaproteobacteria bacterium]